MGFQTKKEEKIKRVNICRENGHSQPTGSKSFLSIGSLIFAG